MKFKYIEERFGALFHFATQPDGTWDLESHALSLSGLDPEEAERLIQNQAEMIDLIHRLCCALEEYDLERLQAIYYRGED